MILSCLQSLTPTIDHLIASLCRLTPQFGFSSLMRALWTPLIPASDASSRTPLQESEANGSPKRTQLA
ncbi:hypothetical protein QJS10_CPB12g00787 [Acorus calamus]|uniref:Uncharacterized protein n=1 Tax=Acorus calamus TaxID=4465 RepID=A0AAV9DQH8_ACOCL|nr:hypothetical protein QJS10_CPB12g00787 [Acorus calamus]